MRRVVLLLLLIGLAASMGLAYPQSDTAEEVKAVIIESYEDGNRTLVTRMDDYSMHGALEFWSSGGLLQEVSCDAAADEYDILSIQPKHIVCELKPIRQKNYWGLRKKPSKVTIRRPPLPLLRFTEKRGTTPGRCLG